VVEESFLMAKFQKEHLKINSENILLYIIQQLDLFVMQTYQNLLITAFLTDTQNSKMSYKKSVGGI